MKHIDGIKSGQRKLSHAGVKLACIYSLPRSGSTALVTQLDKFENIVCLPESYFPQIYEMLSPTDVADSRRLAALFLASSPDGSLLSLPEIEDCMVPGNLRESLVNLGFAYTRKTGRDQDRVKCVVWKTTRIIGRWRCFAEAGGIFILLRRKRLNVYESQFRVNFGIHNRNSIRFSAFCESYEAAFSRLPCDKKVVVNYEDIPNTLPLLVTTLGGSGEPWGMGRSSLADTSAKNSWHSEIMKDFQSKDHIKLNNVGVFERFLLLLGGVVFRPARPVFGILRDRFDFKIMKQVYEKAEANHNSWPS